MLGDASAGRAVDPRRDRLPAQHRHAAHRRAAPAAQPAGAGELELPRSIPTPRRATVTYWMNSLQAHRRPTRPLLVTLNGADDDRSRRTVLAEFEYDHPVFDVAAMRAQRRRHEIQGVRGISFAGAYWGYGFHEDGVQSGIEVADAVRRAHGERRRSCYEGTAAPPPARTRRRASSRRACSSRTSTSTRSRTRSTVCRLVGPPPRAGALPRRDFFDGDGRPLGDGVRDLVQERLGRRPDGPVHLLAQLRTLGWVFNPLAVYYCWDRDGRALDAVVLEVTNTPWGERHWYVFDARTRPRPRTHARKAMHVSPFLPMDVDYRVSWTAPGDELACASRSAWNATAQPVFAAGLSRCDGGRSTAGRAVGLLVRYPMLPLRGVGWRSTGSALALWLAAGPGVPPRPPRRRGGDPMTA